MSLQPAPGSQVSTRPIRAYLRRHAISIIGAALAIGSQASKWFQFGTTAIDWLGRIEFVRDHLPSLIKFLRVAISPEGSNAVTVAGLALFFLSFFVMHYRKETQTIQNPAGQVETVSRVAPNFVCTGVGMTDMYEQYGALQAGKAKLRNDELGAAVAEICNKFSAARKVGSVRYVSAEIDYTTNGRTVYVKRGSWLSTGAYKLDFHVNDSRELIIAGVASGDHPVVFYLMREVRDDGSNDLVDRAVMLEQDSYDIKVRLIRESEGTVYKKFDFTLEITRTPKFAIKLTQIHTQDSSD